MKVLIADDSPTTRFVLKKNLVTWGYEVIEASDGAEALRWLEDSDPPRIAILDWMMPGVDGVTICRRLQNLEELPFIYTILLSSKSSKEEVVYALDSGAYIFQTKPINLDELRSYIEVGRRLVTTDDERKRFAHEMALLATIDPLTGVFNRRHFFERGAEELHRAKRYLRTFAVMMIDIDHFKVINDSWGHATGDVALCQLCAVAEETLRENDIFGRVGGEEFAVLLPETTSAGAVAAGERLRRAVEQLELASGEGDPIRLTASFGVTAYRAADQSFEDLVSRADDALYEAKSRGRNRVCVSARPSSSAGATSPPSSIEPLGDQAEELLELERMEEYLRESDERQKELVESLKIGVYVSTATPQGRFLQANRAAASIFGYDSVEDLLRIPPLSLYRDPADRARLLEELARGGSVRNRVVHMVSRRGEPVVASITSTATLDADGKIRWISGAIEEVSDRERLQEELRAANEELVAKEASLIEAWQQTKRLFEAAPVALLLVSTETATILEANALACDVMISSSSQLLGRPFIELLADNALADELLETLRGPQRVFDLQAKIKRPGASPGWALLSGQPLVHEGREAVLIGILDITDRKVAEDELRDSEQRYRTLSERSPDAMIVSKGDGEILFANPAAARLVGLDSVEALVGRSQYDFVPVERQREAQELVERLMLGMMPTVRAESPLLRDDDQEIFTESVSTPIVFRRRSAVLTVARDMSSYLERERSRAARLEFEALLNSISVELIDLSSDQLDAVVERALSRFGALLNADRGFLLRAGDEATGEYHWSRPGLPTDSTPLRSVLDGRIDEALVVTDVVDLPQPWRQLFQARQDRSVALVPMQAQRRQLGLLGFEAREPSPRWTEDVADLLGTLSDLLSSVFHRIERRRELLETQAADQRTSQLSDDLLASISHEIRSPMNAIVGMTELLLETVLSTVQRDFVSTIDTSSRALLEVIETMLDVSKAGAGKIDLVPAPFDLEGLVDQVGLVMAAETSNKNLELIVRYAPGAPRRVVGDGVRLRQVLLNLVGNAVRFTERGLVMIDVEAQAPSSSSALFVIRVKDTGIGIEAEHLDGIFKQFNQGGLDRSRRSGGAGLGLTLSRHLVELMDGRLTVESRPGFGSVFTCEVTLPLAEGEADSEASGISELRGRRALIIDDNPVSAEVLAEKLRAWGLTVTAAQTTDEALEALSADEPLDALLIDDTILLTEADALLEQLDRDQADQTCRLIALSSPESGEALLGLGSHRSLELVVKPVRDQRLLEALTTRSGGGAEPRAPSEDELSGLRWRAWALVVEDDPTNQHTTRLLLNRFGLEVVLARDGNEALDRLAEQPFNLLFMDCHLPVLDGREATRRIRRSGHSWANVPVVAMTAFDNPRERDACFSAGMSDYLAKPLRKRTLAQVLSRHLGPADRIDGRPITRALLIDGGDAVLCRARRLIRELWPSAAVRFVHDAFDCCLSIGNIQPDLVMARLETLGDEALRLIEVLDTSQRLRSLRFLFVTALPLEDPLCQSVIEAGAELCDDEELANELRRRLSQPPEERPQLTTTQPGPIDEAPVIDPRVIHNLLGDDLASIRRLFSLFFEDVYHQLSLLSDPDSMPNESLRRVVHRLQGAAGDVGAEWLRTAAHELEEAVNRCDQRRCQELIEDLREHIERLRLAVLARGWISSELSR